MNRNTPNIKCILLAVFLLVVIGCNQSASIDPNNFNFAGKTYYIEYDSKKIELISKTDSFVLRKSSGSRHISPCPTHKLIAADIDRDGKGDLCYYDCGFVEIYINTKLNLSKTEPILLEYKEHHWVDKTPNQNIDLEDLKGLDKIEDIIREIDPDI